MSLGYTISNKKSNQINIAIGHVILPRPCAIFTYPTSFYTDPPHQIFVDDFHREGMVWQSPLLSMDFYAPPRNFDDKKLNQINRVLLDRAMAHLVVATVPAPGIKQKEVQ